MRRPRSERVTENQQQRSSEAAELVAAAADQKSHALALVPNVAQFHVLVANKTVYQERWWLQLCVVSDIGDRRDGCRCGCQSYDKWTMVNHDGERKQLIGEKGKGKREKEVELTHGRSSAANMLVQ